MKNTLIELFNKKDFSKLSEEFIRLINYYGYENNDSKDKYFKELDEFVGIFLEIFTNKEFYIPENQREEYINQNPLISNLIYLSSFENTDQYINSLSKEFLQKDSDTYNRFVKFLTLYSVRNNLYINYQFFFSFDSNLSSIWYSRNFIIDGCITEKTFENLIKHIDNIELIKDFLKFSNLMYFPYFLSTYFFPQKDKIVKEIINSLIKNKYSEIKIKNNPDKKKIAVISSLFSQKYSVYRVTYKFIKSLASEYEITLIHSSANIGEIDTRCFKNIINLKFINGEIDLTEIKENNFSLVFFPDIGLNIESIILSNIRIAPVQIATAGHPVSTFGGEIDYYISGDQTEFFDKIKENYSERVFLLPGKGVHAPNVKYLSLNISNVTGKFIIACPWTSQKINYKHLMNLKKILANSKKDLVFRFFPGNLSLSLLYTFEKEICSILPKENIEIISSINYQKYMQKIEESDIVIDSFPFGGNNIAIDALYLKKPFVAFEGDKLYNKFAAATLKDFDITEVIASRDNEFIVKVLKLINNDEFRLKIIQKIKNTDFHQKLFNVNSSEYFKLAVDYIIENNEVLKINNKNHIVFDLKDEYVSENFINQIQKFYFTNILNSPDFSSKLDDFLKYFLSFFIKNDFIVPQKHYNSYIKSSSLLSNLVSLSSFGTTDQFLSLLLNSSVEEEPYFHNNILIKILTLYSARNTIKVNYHKLFNSNSNLSSIWYIEYFNNCVLVKENTCKNFEKHADNIEKISELFNVQFLGINSPYFFSSYISPDKDKKLRNIINVKLQEQYNKVQVKNTPEKKKIAVVSEFLYKKHAVYRCLIEYLRALKPDYELTLIHIGEWVNETDTSIFEKIIKLKFNNKGGLNISPILENNFSLVFFTDLGMNSDSVFLSNLRIAPVQVAGLGHSVSSHGSKIDYFISGTDTEDIDKIYDNYSERVVLIKGIGLHPEFSSFEKKESNNRNKRFLILCPWSLHKINYKHLANLKEIILKSQKKLLFRFLTGFIDNGLFRAFKKEIEELLGKENIEVFPLIPYEKFMGLYHEAEIAIDSYHFGGYNSVVDALFLNKPVITITGTKAYNRFASALLKNSGLNELIAKNDMDYIEKVINFINDDKYRNEIIEKINGINLKEKLFNTNEPQYFKKAIDYLIMNNENLKAENSRFPIFIK